MVDFLRKQKDHPPSLFKVTKNHILNKKCGLYRKEILGDAVIFRLKHSDLIFRQGTSRSYGSCICKCMGHRN